MRFRNNDARQPKGGMWTEGGHLSHVAPFANTVTYRLSAETRPFSVTQARSRSASRVRHKHLRPWDIPEASRTRSPRISTRGASNVSTGACSECTEPSQSP